MYPRESLEGRGVTLVVIISIIVVAIALVAVSSYFLLKGREEFTHDTIYIDGNEKFTATNGVVAGSGSVGDPYIIEKWDISAERENGIEIRNTTAHFIIRNCNIHGGSSNSGICLYFVKNGMIENNIVNNNDSGIYLYNSSNNVLKNNICSSNHKLGVLLENSSNNNILNEDCENNILGIQLVNSENNILYNNTCSNNYGYGIWFVESDGNTFNNNTCTDDHYGIHLYYSSKNIIVNNTCKNNTYAVYLESSKNNEIYNNNIRNNDYGFSVCCLSDNNLISKNNLINNASQAIDLRKNCWDNGYLSGGNYWSDYKGQDNFRGENQDIPGSDGIGDTPYFINGDNNIDRYPLMNPAGTDLTTQLKFAGDNTSKIYLAFFGNPGCPPCDDAWAMIIRLEQEYPNLEARRFDFLTKENIELIEALFNLYKVQLENRGADRIVFIGDNYLSGDSITEGGLRSLIEGYSRTGTTPPWEMVEPREEGIIDRFKRWGPLTIVAAGLADGVNPCAFAVVVFFVSYLAYLGRRRREIMLVGVTFIIAVLLTYLLVGVGILLFVRQLNAYSVVSSAVRISIAGLAIALGSVSLYDYYLFRKKGAKAMKLQLPRSLSRRVHAIIRKTEKTAFIIPFAFATGIVISLCELGCTGQLYLPTLTYVMEEPALQAQAFLYLIIYNLMFIIPLLVVFGLASFGVHSEKFAEVSRKQTGKIKIFLAVILFVLAAFLLLTLR